MKKRISIVALAALAGMLLCGCRVSINGMNIVGTYNYSDSERYSIGGGEIAGGISALDIDWVSGRVDIVSYDGEAVRFTESSNKNITGDLAMRYWLDNGRLHIRFCKSGITSYANLNKTLTVWLPAGNMPEEIELDSTSADITAEGLSVDSARFNSTSGELTVTGGHFGASLKADTTSGRVRVMDSTFPDGDIDTVSGDITVEGCSVKHELELDTTSGRVEAVLKGYTHSLSVDSVSGSVRVVSRGVDEFSADSTSGDIKAYFSKQPDKCSIETVSGRVELGLPENADCRVSFDSVSGKFESELPAKKNGDSYTFGDGSARYSIDTTSGSAKIVKVD